MPELKASRRTKWRESLYDSLLCPVCRNQVLRWFFPVVSAAIGTTSCQIQKRGIQGTAIGHLSYSQRCIIMHQITKSNLQQVARSTSSKLVKWTKKIRKEGINFESNSTTTSSCTSLVVSIRLFEWSIEVVLLVLLSKYDENAKFGVSACCFLLFLSISPRSY